MKEEKINEVLTRFSETEEWKVLKKIMRDLLRRNYGWDAKTEQELLINKGAHIFYSHLARKVDSQIKWQ